MKIIFLAIAVTLSVALNAQTNLNADELFYSQHSDEIMQMFNEECPVLELGDGEGPIFQYGLLDFDGDGIKELWLREVVADNGAFFCRGGDSLQIIATSWSKSFVSINGNVVCASGPAGTGAFFSSYSVVENSAITHYASDVQMYNLETDKVDHECEYDGKEVSWKWFKGNFDSSSKKFVAPQNDVWMPFDRLSSDVLMDKVSGTYIRQVYGEEGFYTANVITDGKGNAWFEVGFYLDDAPKAESRSYKWLPIENKTITFDAGDYKISVEMYGRCLYVTESNISTSTSFSGIYYRDLDTFGDNNGNLYTYDYEKEGAVLISQGPKQGKVETPAKVWFEYEGREVPVVGVCKALEKRF